MSVTVDLDKLADTLGDFSYAYLVTVGDDYRARAVAIQPVLTGDAFSIGTVGNGTRRNAAAHPEVTLVWPPRETGGYTLIVDGRADAVGEGLRVTPTGAVLHRPEPPG